MPRGTYRWNSTREGAIASIGCMRPSAPWFTSTLLCSCHKGRFFSNMLTVGASSKGYHCMPSTALSPLHTASYSFCMQHTYCASKCFGACTCFICLHALFVLAQVPTLPSPALPPHCQETTLLQFLLSPCALCPQIPPDHAFALLLCMRPLTCTDFSFLLFSRSLLMAWASLFCGLMPPWQLVLLSSWPPPAAQQVSPPPPSLLADHQYV